MYNSFSSLDARNAYFFHTFKVSQKNNVGMTICIKNFAVKGLCWTAVAPRKLEDAKSISVKCLKLLCEAELKLESSSTYLVLKCNSILHSLCFKKYCLSNWYSFSLKVRESLECFYKELECGFPAQFECSWIIQQHEC